VHHLQLPVLVLMPPSSALMVALAKMIDVLLSLVFGVLCNPLGSPLRRHASSIFIQCQS
jgi:hypothetical protein